jgi:hypothetical protein
MNGMARLLLDNSKQIVFFHDEQLVAVDFDGLTAVFAKQNTVTHLNAQGFGLALVIGFARAYRQDFTLVWLFSGAIWNHNPRGSFGFAVNAFHDYAVG